MRELAWRPILFALVCAVQIAIPTWMILQAEETLGEGVLFRFRTVPIDPGDLMRGRYVALRFEATHGPPLDDRPFVLRETVYALLEHDPEGFARVVGVQHDEPQDAPYLAVKGAALRADQVYFRFPIDRFYMSEEKAPEAERLSRALRAKTWAEIRVLDGRAVIEDLVIEGVPIAQVVEEQAERAP